MSFGIGTRTSNGSISESPPKPIRAACSAWRPSARITSPPPSSFIASQRVTDGGEVRANLMAESLAHLYLDIEPLSRRPA